MPAKIAPAVFPTLTYDLDADAGLEIIEDKSQGLRIEWNCTDATNDAGVPRHCGRLVSHDVDPSKLRLLPAAMLEARLFDADVPSYSVPNMERKDASPSSHTTGGGRRSYVWCSPRLFEQWDNQAAYDALVQFNLDQLKRPLSHSPWDFKCDPYSCQLRSGWKYDQSDPQTGWGGWDPAHLETGPFHGLGLIGDALGAAQLFMLIRWVLKSLPPGKSHWRNQPRATGWMLRAMVHAHHLGLSSAEASIRDNFFGGRTPRQALSGYVDELIAKPPEYGAGSLDPRCMPVIKSPDAEALGLKPGSEILGSYGWQEMIQLYCLGYAADSTLLDAVQVAGLLSLGSEIAIDLGARIFDSSGKMSYSFSRHRFDDLVGNAQAVADVCTRLDVGVGDRTFEVDPRGGIRSVPRTSDVELALAPMARFLGVADPRVQAIEQVCRNQGRMPGQPKWRDEGARYIEPYMALVAQATAG